MKEFRDAWVKSGEGDILPASGEHADLVGVLSDVDVFDPVIELLEQRLEDAKADA